MDRLDAVRQHWLGAIRQEANAWVNVDQDLYHHMASPGGRLNIKISSYQYRDPMLKIRRSCDRLIFNMGIPIPGKDGLYNETGSRTQ